MLEKLLLFGVVGVGVVGHLCATPPCEAGR